MSARGSLAPMTEEPSQTSPAAASVGVGVLGAGTVGAAFLRLLARRSGVRVTAVLVRDATRARDVGDAPVRLTTDPDEVLQGADVVVELIGGVDHATVLMERAAAGGARLVTANKAALAEAWPRWAPLVAAGRVGFEAAVMAGTPVIGPLAGALRGSRPIALHALLNGTCAYILARLESGMEMEEALGEAQRLGIAEADPSLDVDGIDAAHKLTVLARLAFDPDLSWEEVARGVRGIRALDGAAVRAEMRRERRVRLVASIWAGASGWRTAVRPVSLPLSHPLVRVGADRNAMVFVGDAVGEVVIAGAGAGADPTASAVLADVLDAVAGRPGPGALAARAPLPSATQDDDPLDAWT
jgi:homoserine dehydrogenase